jgi:hypothetical protein
LIWDQYKYINNSLEKKMALLLRRGVDADRSGITPAEGELIYTTDTKKVYVGDGATAGGNEVTGSGGGGGTAPRTTVSGTTANIGNGVADDVDITSAAKAYSVLSIEVDQAAWVRVYSSAAARTNDSGRSEGVDPDPDAGVHAEIITTGATTVKFTPSSVGWNDENPVTDTIYLTVTNKSGSANTITTTLLILPLET